MRRTSFCISLSSPLPDGGGSVFIASRTYASTAASTDMMDFMFQSRYLCKFAIWKQFYNLLRKLVSPFFALRSTTDVLCACVCWAWRGCFGVELEVYIKAAVKERTLARAISKKYIILVVYNFSLFSKTSPSFQEHERRFGLEGALPDTRVIKLSSNPDAVFLNIYIYIYIYKGE